MNKTPRTTKYYLVPMWNYKNNKMKNHLALIEAADKYQAMLIAIGSHNWDLPDKDGYESPVHKADKWHVDYNYNAYQEIENPEQIFTYMNRGK